MKKSIIIVRLCKLSKMVKFFINGSNFMEEYIVLDFSEKYLALINKVGDRRLYARYFENGEPEFAGDKLSICPLNQLSWEQIVIDEKVRYKNEHGTILDDSTF